MTDEALPPYIKTIQDAFTAAQQREGETLSALCFRIGVYPTWAYMLFRGGITTIGHRQALLLERALGLDAEAIIVEEFRRYRDRHPA